MLHRETVRPQSTPRPMRRKRLDKRTLSVRYIIGAALRHYAGQEKAELLATAYRIQCNEVWS